MPIAISCPQCSHRMKVPDDAGGKRATCPKCQSKFVIETNVSEPPISTQSAIVQTKKNSGPLPRPTAKNPPAKTTKPKPEEEVFEDFEVVEDEPVTPVKPKRKSLLNEPAKTSATPANTSNEGKPQQRKSLLSDKDREVLTPGNKAKSSSKRAKVKEEEEPEEESAEDKKSRAKQALAPTRKQAFIAMIGNWGLVGCYVILALSVILSFAGVNLGNWTLVLAGVGGLCHLLCTLLGIGLGFTAPKDNNAMNMAIAGLIAAAINVAVFGYLFADAKSALRDIPLGREGALAIFGLLAFHRLALPFAAFTVVIGLLVGGEASLSGKRVVLFLALVGSEIAKNIFQYLSIAAGCKNAKRSTAEGQARMSMFAHVGTFVIATVGGCILALLVYAMKPGSSSSSAPPPPPNFSGMSPQQMQAEIQKYQETINKMQREQMESRQSTGSTLRIMTLLALVGAFVLYAVSAGWQAILMKDIAADLSRRR